MTRSRQRQSMYVLMMFITASFNIALTLSLLVHIVIITNSKTHPITDQAFDGHIGHRTVTPSVHDKRGLSTRSTRELN